MATTAPHSLLSIELNRSVPPRFFLPLAGAWRELAVDLLNHLAPAFLRGKRSLPRSEVLALIEELIVDHPAVKLPEDQTASMKDWNSPSYPSSSVVRLLNALPNKLPLLHWGDTDPWGYDILRVLRLKTGRAIEAFRMAYRPAVDGLRPTRRESSILQRLLNESAVADVKAELLAMQRAGNKGKFEQESLPIN